MAKFPKNFSRFLIKLRLSQFHYTKILMNSICPLVIGDQLPIDIVNSLNKISKSEFSVFLKYFKLTLYIVDNFLKLWSLYC